MTRLAIVTATVDLDRSKACRFSWPELATEGVAVYTVVNGASEIQASSDQRWLRLADVFGGPRHFYYAKDILGVVPAYAIGVQQALEDGAEVIACLHDDLLIEEEKWDRWVWTAFDDPKVGLVGFGGGVGLGAGDLYQTPYNPMQLARQGFVSNMRDAEAHGERCTIARPVACLDGFSQIGRAKFWQGWANPKVEWSRTCIGCGAQRFAGSALAGRCAFCDGQENNDTSDSVGRNLFDLMQQWGVVHHFYDGMLGCFAKRLGWQVWMLPVACHHFGGQTAVANSAYQEWAAKASYQIENEIIAQGDAAFWHTAHLVGYDEFRDVLPIRL